MVGGDNIRVIEEGSIISEAIGSLGPSLRGKTLIYDHENKVVGIVSVGFLLEDVNRITKEHAFEVILLTLVVLSIGIAGALLIAKEVKRVIFGLEPQEISSLYEEKRVILETIREGIIAVDRHGVITMVNQVALKMLGLTKEEQVLRKNLLEVLPYSRLMDIVHSGEAEYDQEVMIGEHVVIANRIPIMNKNQEVIGAVSSFRNKSELSRITEELSEVKRYAEALRLRLMSFPINYMRYLGFYS